MASADLGNVLDGLPPQHSKQIPLESFGIPESLSLNLANSEICACSRIQYSLPGVGRQLECGDPDLQMKQLPL